MNKNIIKNSSLDILNQLATTIVDSQNLEEIHQAAIEQNKPFRVTYPLSNACDKNKDLLEELWAALGAACDYDIRNLCALIDEQIRIQEEEGKEAEDE